MCSKKSFANKKGKTYDAAYLSEGYRNTCGRTADVVYEDFRDKAKLDGVSLLLFWRTRPVWIELKI